MVAKGILRMLFGEKELKKMIENGKILALNLDTIIFVWFQLHALLNDSH